MKIERVISRFDRQTEELIDEKSVADIPLDDLKIIFKPKTDDPLMYNPYTINLKEAEELKKISDIHFDLEHFFYQLDCFQAK